MKSVKALFVLFGLLLFLYAFVAVAAPQKEKDSPPKEETSKVLQEEIHLVHDFIIPPPPGYVISENLMKVMNEEKKHSTDKA